MVCGLAGVPAGCQRAKRYLMWGGAYSIEALKSGLILLLPKQILALLLELLSFGQSELRGHSDVTVWQQRRVLLR